jgi:hypothetical protein
VPLWVPTIFNFERPLAAPMHLLEALVNHEDAETGDKGDLPAIARPDSTPTILDSAMPQEKKKRSGNSLAKSVVIVDLERSASTTTMSLFSRSSSTSVRPTASRLAGHC